MRSEAWSGGWTEERLGIAVRTVESTAGERVEDLVGVGLRRNTRRAHLLVSNVLGKHVPADPRVVRDAGWRLGGLVAARLAGDAAVVVGFAETATLLGHLVAESLGATYIHSTRRVEADAKPWAAFTESHSHAPSHVLRPWPSDVVAEGAVVVLVDDEISTAQTALAAIRQIQALAPRSRYVIASLVDMRDQSDRAKVSDAAADMGVVIDCVALAQGAIELPQSVVIPDEPPAVGERGPAGKLVRLHVPWPGGVREGGRHGFPGERSAFDAAVTAAAAVVTDVLPRPSGRTHVLGTEEFMYAPLRIALELPGEVTFSTTTRSPAVVLDEPGYPLRHGIAFPAHDAGASGMRFAYNLRPDTYDHVVLVVDSEADTPELRGLVGELRRLTPVVLVVVLPTYRPPAPLRGPMFGSYPTESVGWLLTDLSGIALEAPTDVRERARRAGDHYAQTLPIEYEPSQEYQTLFHQALTREARRVALSVAVVGEQIRALRGPDVVLASLARAGTPVGVLLRQWAKVSHDLDWPHYSLSIVRDRGIDELALRYIADHHDERRVIFVDGWTGKGAITEELVSAVAAANARLGTSFDDRVAVLADPGHCVEIFGTRDDFLIPSACLNSTVSGLVSRTVLNHAVLRPDQFHGAKFYRDLAGADSSRQLVDTIAACFGEVQARVPEALLEIVRAGRRADWRGLAAVRAIAAEHGIDDLNLVKPGVGETTRMLLRRGAWKTLVRSGSGEELAHLYQLAAERAVPVIEVEGLAFSCVGLILPAAGRLPK